MKAEERLSNIDTSGGLYKCFDDAFQEAKKAIALLREYPEDWTEDCMKKLAAWKRKRREYLDGEGEEE